MIAIELIIISQEELEKRLWEIVLIPYIVKL